MKLTPIAAIAALCILSACSSMYDSAESDFDTIKAAAIAEIDKAKAAGNEWRDSRKLLDSAQAAYDKGDVDTAIELATRAKMQGEMAVTQAEAQQAAGNY